MQKKMIYIQIEKHTEYFTKLLSFDCHATKNEPRNALNSAFLGSCTLFKLVSQEINYSDFNSVFATFYCYICHIFCHDFDWHKNCTQIALTSTR